MHTNQTRILPVIGFCLSFAFSGCKRAPQIESNSARLSSDDPQSLIDSATPRESMDLALSVPFKKGDTWGETLSSLGNKYSVPVNVSRACSSSMVPFALVSFRNSEFRFPSALAAKQSLPDPSKNKFPKDGILVVDAGLLKIVVEDISKPFSEQNRVTASWRVCEAYSVVTQQHLNECFQKETNLLRNFEQTFVGGSCTEKISKGFNLLGIAKSVLESANGISESDRENIAAGLSFYIARANQGLLPSNWKIPSSETIRKLSYALEGKEFRSEFLKAYSQLKVAHNATEAARARHNRSSVDPVKIFPPDIRP